MSPRFQVTFELVTRAYPGAADPVKTDALRPPVLKGLLRFWWRVLHPEYMPHDLFLAESQIFGSAWSGQGLRVVPDPGASGAVISDITAEPDPWLAYMAYGPVRRKETAVQRLDLPYEYGVSLVLPQYTQDGPGLSPRQATLCERLRWRAELECAVWLLSAFGGFGARNRRGNGRLFATPESFHLMDPFSATNVSEAAARLSRGLRKIACLPAVLTEMEAADPSEIGLEWIRVRLEAMTDAKAQATVRQERRPGHASIWQATRLILGRTDRGDGFYAFASDALRAAGEDFYRYRRSLGWYGPKGPEKDFCKPGKAPPGLDHGWRTDRQSEPAEPPDPSAPIAPRSGPEDIAQLRRKSGLPELTAPLATHFGLPLNGFMIGTGNSVDVVVGAGSTGRRASPVFFSVLKWGQGRFTPAILYLPSLFLPDNRLRVEVPDNRLRVEVLDPQVRRNRPRHEWVRWSEPVPDPGDQAITDFLAILQEGRTSIPWGCPKSRWEEVLW
jgi:hypothetical protein